MNTPLITTASQSRAALVRLPEPLQTLYDWSEQGWLRRLDSAMANFLHELDPATDAVVLVSAAVLAHMEGRGHTCLPLAAVVATPQEVLGWPADAQSSLLALWRTLPNTVAQWLEILKSSRLVRSVQSALSGEPIPPDNGQPLVLGGTPDAPLLYLRRYWGYEQQVAAAIRARTAASLPVDQALACRWLKKLFDEPATSANSAASAEPDWQKLACAVALRSGLTVITGGPGTGKTYTAARLLALLFAMDPARERLRVALAAPTGKAAARLRQSIDTSLQELAGRLGAEIDLQALTQRMGVAKTLHALLGARPDTRQFKFNASHLLDVDVLIVDEASMVHLEMMASLLQALPSRARLILLGDKDQLASVEAGAVLADLCHGAVDGHYNPQTQQYAQAVANQTLPPGYLSSFQATPLAQQTVMLRQSRRFAGPIGQLAQAVNAAQPQQARALLGSDSTQALHAIGNAGPQAVVQLAVQGRPGGQASYADYLKLVAQYGGNAPTDAPAHAVWVKAVLTAFDRFRLLCAVHQGDWGTQTLNLAVQQALADKGLLKPRGEWFAGRPIMVTRNDPELGVFNGDIGVVLPDTQANGALRAYFSDGDSLRAVGVNRLASVETAFAMTVHKAQGSEFEHTVLVLPATGAEVLTRELIYTGITRARQSFTLVEGRTGVLEAGIIRQAVRASGLGDQIAS